MAKHYYILFLSIEILIYPAYGWGSDNNRIGCGYKEAQSPGDKNVVDLVGTYTAPIDESIRKSLGYSRNIEFNRLEISHLRGNLFNVNLSTWEVNYNECGVDNEALLCDDSMYIIPNDNELAILNSTHREPPVIGVSRGELFFRKNKDGFYLWGPPYCGLRGSLYHKFKRSTKKK